MEPNKHIIILQIPFPNKNAALIAYRTLSVDKGPGRSTTSVVLSTKNNILCAKFEVSFSNNPKQDAVSQLKKLRISMNHWINSLSLVCETMAEFGDPSADMPEPTRAINGDLTV